MNDASFAFSILVAVAVGSLLPHRTAFGQDEWSSADPVAIAMDEAWTQLAEKNDKRARDVLSSVVKSDAAPADAFLLLGTLERKYGEKKRALETFERGLSFHPHHVNLNVEYAVSLSWEGKHDAAIDALERVLALDPHHRGGKLLLGRVLAWKGQGDRARKPYKQLLERNENDIDAIKGLAFVERTLLRKRQAIHLYERALALNPDDGEAKEGVRETRKISRYASSVEFGAAKNDAMWNYQAALGLRADVSPDVVVSAGYASLLAPDDVVLLASPTVSHRIDAGAAWRKREGLTLGLYYQLNVLGKEPIHRLDGRLDIEVAPQWILMGGIRPGFSHVGRREIRGDLGVQRLFDKGHWVSVQVFAFDSTQTGSSSWTAASTASLALAPRFRSTTSVGIGTISGVTAYRFSTGFEWSISDRLDVAAAYNGFRLNFSRHAISIRTTVRY